MARARSAEQSLPAVEVIELRTLCHEATETPSSFNLQVKAEMGVGGRQEGHHDVWRRLLSRHFLVVSRGCFDVPMGSGLARKDIAGAGGFVGYGGLCACADSFRV